ncbi:YceD family protein [Pseudalkalibacillus caeni]|uniref:DUF177 domain-containing protein n=1 Tax=Exobacillus caeni TaxID=2574798 RepID=A0A5R9F9W3_9BACL|nr:YceD family protein [Pseudalkalibacillus caeni]TLS37643.1 DUF177 domain-containing protein [Pseudalkalibacillus caeni]
MKWSVEQLKALKHKGLSIDETIDVSDLKKRDSDIRGISPVHVKGHASFHGDNVSFHLNIEGEMILPCANTLEDVEFPFDIDTIETFILDPINDFSEDDEEENEEIHQIRGNTVDLLPYIKENILLEIPIRVVKEDVNPNQSGKGWEVVDKEEDNKEKVDPRLAGLADFFNKKDN